MATHVYTSVVSNYIPKARVLAHSLKRFHPDFQFHLVLCDDAPADFRIEEEPFDSLITVDGLGIPDLEPWLFVHSLVEVSTGVKGFALRKILAQPSCSEVFYFDPDVVILAPLDELLADFVSGAVLLTPHLTEPETSSEAILDNEFSVLQHGVYNLGFVGVKNSEEGRRFANWWCDRLRDFCFDDIPRGLFTDQRWADLAPAYFSGCVILRDPVHNVATWNLTSRRIEGTPDKPTVDGRRVVFYHFSGFDSGAQETMLNKYGADMPVLYALREWYIAECSRMGQEKFGGIPWRFGRFDNGEPITPQHRKLYRDRGDVRRVFPNPYVTSEISRSYYHWYEADSAAAQLRPAAKTQPVPEYRVALSVTGNDAKSATATANSVLKNSRGASELLLVGPDSALEALLVDPTLAAAYRRLEGDRQGTHTGNFAATLSQLGDRDFLFVQEGVEVPEYWDLRLAWTARRHTGTATVSPLSGSHPLPGATGSPNWASDTNTLDQASYSASEFESIEAPEFLQECVYVVSQAADEVRSQLSASGPSGCDFAAFLAMTRSLRYSHLIADHIYVACNGAQRIPGVREGNGDSSPGWTVSGRQMALMVKPGGARPMAAVTRTRQLHVMHSWGGGLARWVREYCRADRTHTNFVLQSIGTWNSFGMELRLYRDCDDPEPVQVWPLKPAIKGTAATHETYRSALAEIVERYGIGRILISSFIGHSLDLLESGIPGIIVCHDYYPFCPALNITFGELCRECDGNRLTACSRENPHHRFFLNVPPSGWLDLRRAFAEKVQRTGIPMIAPSPSVRENYVNLEPDLGAALRVIPHGTRPVASAPLQLSFAADRLLRVLVLGSIALNKGLALLQQAAPRLLEFGRLLLVGCGPDGKVFEGMPGVTMLAQYRWDNLPAILRELEPDIALLPSSVPETFSYTLEELNQLAIPTLATRTGSFANWIQDGLDGFLCEPHADAIVSRLREIAANRSALSSVHERLKSRKPRTIGQMIADYETIAPSPWAGARAYFCPDSRADAPNPDSGRAQLYWRSADQPYAERQSVSVAFERRANRQVLRFPIPALQPAPAELRFDPAERSGLLLLHSMKLLDAHASQLGAWACVRASIEALTRSEITVLGEPTGDRGVVLLLGNTDPLAIVPLPSGGRGLEGGGTFEAEFTWLPSSEPHVIMAAKESGETARLSTMECDRLIEKTGAFRGQEVATSQPLALAGALEQELTAAHQRIADLENSLSWRASAPLRVVGGLALNLNRRVPRRNGSPRPG